MQADHELLRAYGADRSESAFTELVNRHANLVYSTAFHQLGGNADLARDVTQVVFTDLALKAASLRPSVSLAGWLYTSARFAAAKLVRSEQRRHAREQKALVDNFDFASGASGDDPATLRPVIEAAMQDLDDADREAILLRYFEGRDFKSHGTTLGISNEAARKRVLRAVERLRAILCGRGITSPESALLAALSGTATLAVPADLHASIARSALAVSIASSSNIAPTLFQIGRMKTALVFAGLVLGLGTPTLLQHDANSRLKTENDSLAAQLAAVRSAQTQLRARQNGDDQELARQFKEHSELLKLRDEVTRLRSALRKQGQIDLANAHETDERAINEQQVNISSKFAKIPASALRAVGLDAIGIDVSGTGVTAILTDPQFRALLRAFEQRTQATILAAPSVTTLNNRQAQIEIVEEGVAENGEAKLGPSLDVLPVVSTDQQSISLLTSAQLSELIPMEDRTGVQRKQVLQTSVSGNCLLKDGETAVLCQQISPANPEDKAQAADPTFLVVMATPTLIDRAGNRIHASQQPSAKVATPEAAQTVDVK